jgi:hypothetical protein
VTLPDDDPADMTRPDRPLDDAAAERLLRGAPVDDRPELDPLRRLVQAVGRLDDATPEPRGALAALLFEGFSPEAPPTPAPDVPHWAGTARARRTITGRRVGGVAGLSLAAKVLLGSGVAVAGVTSAAGAGALPPRVQDRVAVVVEALTPFQVPHSSRAPVSSTETQPKTKTKTKTDSDPDTERTTRSAPPARPSPSPAPSVSPAPVLTTQSSPSVSASPTPSPTPSPDVMPPTGTPTPTPTPTPVQDPTAPTVDPDPLAKPTPSPTPSPTDSAGGDDPAAVQNGPAEKEKDKKPPSDDEQPQAAGGALAELRPAGSGTGSSR